MPVLNFKAAQWRGGSRSIDVAHCVKVAVADRTVAVRDGQDLMASYWSPTHGHGLSIAPVRCSELARGVE